MYQQTYQPPHRSAGDMIKSMVSDTLLAMIVAIGLLLAMVGSWLIGLMDTAGGVHAGQVLRSLGITALIAGSLLGAILRNDWDKNIRGALVGFATVMSVLAFWFFAFMQ
jgi:hypothetical protein